MPRLGPPALLATAALTLAACGGAGGTTAGGTSQTATVSHAQGTVSAPVDPQKMVVLDFGALDTITALGAADKVAAIPSRGLPAFLDRYQDTARVGTMQEPDVEAIAALEPDVIVIGGRSADAYKELSEIAPTVDLTAGTGGHLKELEKQATTLGAILGEPELAKDKMAAVTTAVTDATTSLKGADDAMLLMTSGGKVSAFGPGSRFALVHDVLGVKPSATGLKQDRHGQAVSFEFIAQHKPTNLLVIDRDAAIGQEGKAAKQVLDNALVASTPAWKSNKVAYLDGQRWYVAGTGLDNTIAMVDEVEKALAG
ncbi:MAG: ABC transporter substrate-binding protein [Micrococcales bacterium]|nr:ABC transporter substrate-binding protein [Micrococcales bacterium]